MTVHGINTILNRAAGVDARKIGDTSRKTLDLYVSLIGEVKYRLEIIGKFAMGKFRDTIPAQMAREICFLQLRMVFEVTAIAVLALHQTTRKTMECK
jgi:hypothetical protein